jgi:hypothetical protein
VTGATSGGVTGRFRGRADERRLAKGTIAMSLATSSFGTSSFGTTESGFSDEELTALALGADPDQLPDEDAVPLSFYQQRAPGGLPQWYMPPVVVGPRKGWRLPVVVSVIAGFLLVDAFGFCITYGQLVFA